ncbi:MAG: hypothetical protein QOE70_3722 [Chthoniobacter sp.]|jgi:uncharacterized membrane protein YkvA (DUF1232 family)|nr:hypothetical protein [Chthoniobacter sp.]
MKFLRSLFVFLLGVLATLYLLNPGAGFIELIPDNIPFLGNLDEAAATGLLLACLRYFGVDPVSLFQRKRKEDEEPVIDVEGRRVP